MSAVCELVFYIAFCVVVESLHLASYAYSYKRLYAISTMEEKHAFLGERARGGYGQRCLVFASSGAGVGLANLRQGVITESRRKHACFKIASRGP